MTTVTEVQALFVCSL